ncbi:MAG: hypothetical protein KIT87_05940 [Anaerolineae bacterium]|nr:hypothetical protein [Anaerolineae bacterium]
MNNRLLSNWRGLALFLLGLVIGWFVIGWWLWPSGFGGPRPAQLEHVSRQDYLALVADSYAQNGNLAVVQQRLEGFDLNDAARELDDLARRSDEFGLNAQAARLRNLANVVRRDLLRTAAQPTAAPKTTIAPTAQPSTGLGEQARDIFGGLRQGWLVGLVLALVIVALLAYAAVRWRLDRLLKWSPRAADGGEAAAEDTGGGRTAGDIEDQPLVYVSLNQLTRISYSADGPDRTEIRIKDANKDMVGQVELRAAEILGRTPGEPPAALELRLFDRHEPRTRVAVLVSHAASQDPTARQLIASMSSDYVKPAFDVSRLGRVVELDTRFIHLQAEVVDAVFGEGGHYPPFQYLCLEITPMPASQGGQAVLDEGQEEEADQRTVNISPKDKSRDGGDAS